VNADQRPQAAAPAAADLMRVITQMSDELARLRAQHTELRSLYADLLAAARTTLSVARDGELDALAYLADELTAGHGQHDLDPPRWAVDR
jgi:hypothetical protein